MAPNCSWSTIAKLAAAAGAYIKTGLVLEELQVGVLRGLVTHSAIMEGENAVQIPSSLMIATGKESSYPLLEEEGLGNARIIGKLAADLLKRSREPAPTELPGTFLAAWLKCLPSSEEILRGGAWSAAFFEENHRDALAVSPVGTVMADVSFAIGTLQQMNIHGKVSLQDAQWGVHLALSRKLRGLADDEDFAALVPVVDFANHDDDANSKLWCTQAEGCSLRAIRDIRPGEELRWTYAVGSNISFLVTYGFIPASNPVAFSFNINLEAEDVTMLQASGCSDALVKKGVVTFSLKSPLGVDEPNCMRVLAYIDGAKVGSISKSEVWNIIQRETSPTQAHMPSVNHRLDMQFGKDLSEFCYSLLHTNRDTIVASLSQGYQSDVTSNLQEALRVEGEVLQRCTEAFRLADLPPGKGGLHHKEGSYGSSAC